MVPTRNEVKSAVKDAREQSALSWPRIIGTALAAVTMTLISTRLSSVFGALLLTAIISIGSALAAEFYRVVLTVTAEGTKKVIVPAILDVESADEANDGETEIIDMEAVEEAEPSAEDQVDEQVHKRSRNPNQLVALALVFGLVSLFTIGVSYSVARSQGGDIYNNTTIENPVQKLTDEQTQKLVDLATQASKDGAPDLKTVLSNYQSLTEQNELLKKRVDSLEGSQKDQVAKLQAEIDALRQDVKNLQGGAQSGNQPPKTP